MLIQRRSTATGRIHSREIAITHEQIRVWQREGKSLQDVVPGLSPEDREYLISGTTPEEWAWLWPEKKGA